MSEFPSWLRLKPGQYVESFVEWLIVSYDRFFDSITAAMLFPLIRLEKFLLWIPWWIIVLVVGLIAWRATRKWQTSLGMMALMMLIGSFGLWDLAMSTLAIVGVATLLAVIIGVPTGIFMARSDTVRAIIRPILDMMQTMPSFVYLIPAMMLFGLGIIPAILATVIYAVAPCIRLTDLGIRQVDGAVIEAAEAFGSSRRQILFGVQLPLAMPAITAGINQTTMMALAMVVIASMIGARGLGQQVLIAIQRLEMGRGFEAGLSIVALAIVIDRITQGFSKQSQAQIEGKKAA
jgi:glycine betaine/proline transport system permease protein